MDGGKTQAKPRHPRARANPLSALTFSWTLPIFWRGYKREMEVEDLYEPLREHASGELGARLSRLWAREATRPKPSLLRVLLQAFAGRAALYGLVLFLMECILRLAQPIFLGRLIAYYSPIAPSPTQVPVSREEAYWSAGAVIACSAINVLVAHPYMMAILHVGMKMRVACCSLIYRKSLRLSKSALGETTVGQVVNLLSNDVNRFDVAVIFVHYLWIGPLATMLITYFMYREIGYSAVVGVAFMLSFIPLQAYLGKRTSVLRLRTALRTDERVRLMNEIIAGVQVIKMYTWEKPFADLVAKARKHEIKQIRATSYIRGVLTSFVMFTTRISLFTSVLAYVLLGADVTAEKVFVVTSYYNILRQTMTVFFPQGIAQIAEANISVKRLEKFMLYDETTKPIPALTDIIGKVQPSSKKKEKGEKAAEKTKEEIKKKDDEEKKPLEQKTENVSGVPYDAEKNGSGLAPLASLEDDIPEATPTAALSVPAVALDSRVDGIQLHNACASWTLGAPDYTLSDITLSVKPGMLVGIVGAVGAGKSSLLQVLLQELPLLRGTVHVGGEVSYAGQEPWLFAGRVRQNILFGATMDRPRYNAVVRRCALDRDFALLPRGDKTVVGERGVSLSGGQRARISLARAVYKRADVYLLDDPLSAVDTRVARHLFESCISGYLSGTTRLLVTHQLQFLKEVHQIVILKNGEVAAQGSYDTLAASGLDFASLLAESASADGDTPLPAPALPDVDNEKDPVLLSFRARQLSIHSVSSVDNLSAVAPPAGREEAEARAGGAVGAKVYAAYAKAAGPTSLLLFVAILAQCAASGADYWTSHWVNLEEARTQNLSRVANVTEYQDILTKLPASLNIMFDDAGLSRYDCIYIYTGIIVALVVITLVRSYLFFWMAMRASTRLHSSMFAAVTRAPMRFFHANPSGRILNRFSKDMGAVDEVLPAAMLDVLQIGLSLLGIVTVVGIVNYWLLLPTFIIGMLFWGLRIFYLNTSRSVKRLEGITRSPVFSHLNATLQGITTIRAFNAQEALIQEFDHHQDLHSTAWYLFIATSRAFGFWLDVICVLYIAFVTLSFLVFETDEFGGNVGLAITQAMGLTGMFQWGMRQSTELENQMTSVERILEYTDIEPEPPLQSAPGRKPPTSWPEEGRVVFKDVYLRYIEDEEAVLRGLSFEVLGGEKVGIVGRTGAGKSSLINALFRLAIVDGSIVIDGRDTATLGLHELRSQISIIPQEPVLFSGTVRHNLDPFDEYPDSVLWRALEEVELLEAVSELAGGLSGRLAEGGSNFSVGQRQLVCLARALVRRNRLLVLDEATANVDPQTDALIQSAIRSKFAECTVLTIAHRLHTVMDSDKVLVMDAGRVVEFAHPHLLLQKSGGVLHSMVQHTGTQMADVLATIAHQNYIKKYGELALE